MKTPLELADEWEATGKTAIEYAEKASRGGFATEAAASAEQSAVCIQHARQLRAAFDGDADRLGRALRSAVQATACSFVGDALDAGADPDGLAFKCGEDAAETFVAGELVDTEAWDALVQAGAAAAESAIAERLACPDCDGQGHTEHLEDEDHRGPMPPVFQDPCRSCAGTGRRPS